MLEVSTIRSFVPFKTKPILSPETRSKIKKIALRCLSELAVALAIGAFISLFNVSFLGATAILRPMLLQTILNVALSAASVFIQAKWKRCAQILDQGRYFTFAYATMKNLQILTHEMGHVAGALAVYKNCRPRIELYPGDRGSSHFKTSQLTALGKKVGRVKANLIVTAAGPALALLVSSLLLGLSKRLQSTHPEWSGHLKAAALSDIAYHAVYALSALKTGIQALPSHDFVILSKMGVHPLGVALAIVAIPFIIS
jgi:hypothetical protein